MDYLHSLQSTSSIFFIVSPIHNASICLDSASSAKLSLVRGYRLNK